MSACSRSIMRPIHIALAATCGLIPACADPPAGDQPSTREVMLNLVSNVPSSPAPADYDGDHKADLSLRDASGQWKIDFASNGFGAWDQSYAGYGGSESIPTPADYDGDGKTDLSVKDNAGNWFIDYSSNGFGHWDISYAGYGFADVIPVPADYDGDGRADLSIKSPAGVWYIDYSLDGFHGWNAILSGYGNNTSAMVPADYDGDGKADISLKGTDGVWYIDYAAGGFGAWNAILPGYGSLSIAVPADYDGDHRTDLAVTSSDGVVLIDYAADGFGSWNAGYSGNGGGTFAPADYNGDSRADFAVKDSLGWWDIDYHAAAGYRGWDVLVNVVQPTATCAANIPTCSIARYDEVPSPTTFKTYYTDLVGRPGITCSAPGDLFLGMSSEYRTFVYYAVCADTQALRDFVPNHDVSTLHRDSSRQSSACNACLPSAPAGQVYVIWTPGTEPDGLATANCPTGCMLPIGI